MSKSPFTVRLLCFRFWEKTDISKVFDLPEELLSSLQPRNQPTDLTKAEDDEQPGDQQVRKNAVSCSLCHVEFQDYTDQRRHMRSDWHSYNIRQKTNGLNTVAENEFEGLIEDLDLSISGSEVSSSGDEGNAIQRHGDVLSSLRKTQASANRSDMFRSETSDITKTAGGAPIVWFSSSLLPSNISLGIYKGLFPLSVEEETVSIDKIRQRQLKPVPNTSRGRGSNIAEAQGIAISPKIFLCMIGGGHFAAMVVSLAPKLTKNSSGLEERQANVVAHKTFHRYTTRRKQGGAQSANDASKGNAHSAGAGIRRYNEAALEAEVRQLLSDWKMWIQECELLFVRATGSSNRRTLFGPYDGQQLRHNDPRIRSLPFSTRRATLSELTRAFVELTKVKANENLDKLEQSAKQQQDKERRPKEIVIDNSSKASKTKTTKEEDEAILHTSQLQALIRRSKAPAVVSYLNSNSLSPNFAFQPPSGNINHHSPTPLHLASSTNVAAVVLALLTKSGSDPTIPNKEGKLPFEVAGERATRDAFRIARSILGEGAWDWQKAHCPPPLTQAEVDRRTQDERAEAQKIEELRRKTEVARLGQEDGHPRDKPKPSPKPSIATSEMSAEDRRELEARGMAPELRAKLERERRARAAEERIKRMTGK
ncbi:hypothetical protein MMC10_000512 [Thelotrema lepadinum]|nr:hypothetical protein [Thelotrema lepadinum]